MGVVIETLGMAEPVESLANENIYQLNCCNSFPNEINLYFANCVITEFCHVYC